MVKTLGLDPTMLDAVRAEGTAVLRRLKPSSQSNALVAYLVLAYLVLA
jgi:hypothetical protein